jgi:hypothetical protein
MTRIFARVISVRRSAFGEIAVFQDARRMATVRARTRVELISIGQQKRSPYERDRSIGSLARPARAHAALGLTLPHTHWSGRRGAGRPQADPIAGDGSLQGKAPRFARPFCLHRLPQELRKRCRIRLNASFSNQISNAFIDLRRESFTSLANRKPCLSGSQECPPLMRGKGGAVSCRRRVRTR